MHPSIAILDFGSQYAQLIARRVREAHVYCELFPWDAPQERIMSIAPRAFILSGGPKSVYEPWRAVRTIFRHRIQNSPSWASATACRR